MSRRVLLIGAGPLPSTDPEQLGFAQLRTEHFRELLDLRHELQLVLLQDEELPVPPGAEAVRPGSAGWLERIRALREDFSPEVVVSAAPYEPARAAALTVGEEPLFIDVPGDPFAEAQAKADHTGERDPTVHMRAAWLPALARGDAFGAISGSQRASLLGQLGLMGRLTGAPAHQERVHVMPAGFDFGSLPVGQPRTWAERCPRFVVALCGGYNTWLDGDSLLEGLIQGMRAIPALHVVSTGGAIPGHHNATYESFRAQAMASGFSGRFTFHGWVPHSVLPRLLSSAQVGVSMDRPGVEAELGTRTRLLFFAHQGLTPMSTTRCDLSKELAGLRMLQPLEMGEPRSLAESLVAAWEEGSDGSTAKRAQGYLESRCAPRRALKGMLDFVEHPFRASPSLDREAELAAELARVKEELAGVYNTPTWKVTAGTRRVLDRFKKR